MCKIDANGQLLYVSIGYISMIEFSMGTMGLEPMTSSARGWQSTKLTYVPVTYSLRVCIIFLENQVDRAGFEPTISPMPRAYPTRLDDRPNFNQNKNSDLF